VCGHFKGRRQIPKADGIVKDAGAVVKEEDKGRIGGRSNRHPGVFLAGIHYTPVQIHFLRRINPVDPGYDHAGMTINSALARYSSE
jgi:hypothetical protein